MVEKARRRLSLERRGIDVGTNFVTRFFGDFVFGVGRRRDTRRERSE